MMFLPSSTTRSPGTVDLRADVGEPGWWLSRLLHRLEARRSTLELWDAYYEGRHPLSFFDDAFRDRFGNRFRRFASNFTALVVDGFAERFEITAFRFLDPEGDADLWEAWQDNDLDGGSQIAITEALIKGTSYTLVTPGLNGAKPSITIEDALDCIVELDPADTRKRRAGLKRWVDDDGKLVVYLYLPERVYRFRSVQKWPAVDATGWPNVPLVEGMTIPAGGFVPFDEDVEVTQNSLGVVPLVPLPNRPRLGRESGQSEIAPIASNQDLINYFRAMAVVGGRYLAFPQRWVTNLDLDVDPETNQPRQPFKAGTADIWTVPPLEANDPRAALQAAQVQFGQFAAADLSSVIKLMEQEIGAMSSISRFPYHYLIGLPSSVPPSGESLNSSEAGLVRKVRRAEIFFGEGFEETLRTYLKGLGDGRASQRTAETAWANPETRNRGVIADAVTKIRAAGIIDDELALDDLGYTPEQIRRLKARQKAAKAAQDAADAAAATEQPPAPDGAAAAMPNPELALSMVPAPRAA